MKVIKQSWSFEHTNDYLEMCRRIEAAGRTCWKSEDMACGKPDEFVARIKTKNHMSVIEHYSFSVRIITDRGVTHELVRHRLCAFSQESTRYCNYSRDKFGNEITMILPVWFEEQWENRIDLKEVVDLSNKNLAYIKWVRTCEYIEKEYLGSLELGQTAQEARALLPNSLKTEIVMTANLREWRHILSLRSSRAAHPQIRALALDMLKSFKELMPVFFDDIIVE